jgi:lipopolysaccharide export system permease protein
MRLAACAVAALTFPASRVNLLDRYIFRNVLFACSAAVALFSFIVIVPNVARDLLPYVLLGQLPADVFTKLVLLLLPFAFTYALPMGMLTGVLLTLGRLSADSEITAMRAAGISMTRVTRSVIFLAVLGAIAALYFNFQSMPSARVEYHRAFAAAVQSNPLSIVVPKTFIRDFPGHVVYVGEKKSGELRDIWVWELDKERRVTRVVRAESGHFEYEEANNVLVLTLTRAQVETRSDKKPEDFSEAQLVASAERSAEPIRLSLDRFFGRAGGARMKQEWLTYSQLRLARAELAAVPLPTDPAEKKKSVLERMKLELIYQDKFNTALAVLSLALIGIPLGIKVSRRETSANFAVAVALTLTYYLMTMAVKVLDRHPEYRPDLLLWLPNIILLCLGGWMLTRIDRR